MNRNTRNYKRILCMCLSGVGDALTFSPFVDELKAARPDIAIDVLVMFRASESIYRSHPAVDEVFFSDFVNQGPLKSFRDILKLRKRKYDAVVVALPANRWEYNVIHVMIGGRRIGHRYLHCDKVNLNFLKQDWVMEDESLHVVEKNLQLLQFFDVPIPDEPAKLSMRLTESDNAAAGDWLARHTDGKRLLIGFHPGSALFKNHVMKRWPKELFAELGRRMVDELNANVLVFGGPEEQELKDEVCAMAQRPDNVLSVDGTTLRESAAIIRKCDAMVANDAALMHVAAAVGTPVVAIFAYTNWRGLYPWRAAHRIVRKDLPCSPCFYYSPKHAFCHAGRDYECIRTITVDEVYSATISLLEETGKCNC